MKKIIIKTVVFIFLLLGSFWFTNQSFATTSSSWNKVGISGFGNGTVYALAAYNNELYAAGDFTEIDGQAIGYIARWNGFSWSNVGTSGIHGTIYSLKVYSNELYIGGDSGANWIYKWNGTTWSGTGPKVPEDNVLTLEVYNNELYAGGHFSQLADGTPARYIAKYNGSTWSAVGTVTPGMNTSVNTLCTYGSNLYAGGDFTTADGVTVNHIAKWNGSAWSAMGSATLGVDGDVRSLAVYNNELYVGGEFSTADDGTANRIAKWDDSSWSAVGTVGLLGTDSFVTGLAVYNNELFAGGSFTTADGIIVNRIAKWNGSAWSKAGTTGMNNIVVALATYNNDLYAGGLFTTADGVTVNRIAYFYIDRTAPTTTASPAGGTYTSDQTVTLTATDSDSSVSATYYTTDGSAPATSSAVYSSPITITQDTTLKFFSIDSIGNIETVKTETYIINKDDTAEKVAQAERRLKKGKKIYLVSELNGQSISGQSLKITFTDLPYKLTKNSNYWIQLIKHKAYPGSLALGSHLSLKKYWLFKTNINKYKVNNSTQKFKIKIAYKYTAKELKVLKNIEPSIPTKDLRLKYRVKAGLNWYQLNNQWKNAKVKHNLSKKKFTVKYFKKFSKSTYYFAIIKK